MKRFSFGFYGVLLVLSAVSPQLRAGSSESLVTLTGEIRPEFSLPSTAQDLQRLQREFSRELAPVSVDVNDLFSSGDEEAIRAAATAIAGIFVKATEDLIDIRFLIYRLVALKAAFEDEDSSDQDQLQVEYHSKLNARYAAFLQRLSSVDLELMKALELCRSEICAKKIVDAQRAVIHVGSAFNYESAIQKGYKNKLVQSAIESRYAQLNQNGTSSDANADLGKKMFSVFVRAGRESLDAKNILFGDKRILDDLDIDFLTLSGSHFKTEVKYLEKLFGAKLRSIVRGVPTEAVIKEGYYYTHVFICFTLRNSIGGHILLYGWNDLECTSRGKEYRASLETFGPGLAVYPGSALVVAIVSPAPISSSNLWVGLGASAGLVAINPEVAVFAGRSASVGVLAGAHGGVGVTAGVKTFRTWREK